MGAGGSYPNLSYRNLSYRNLSCCHPAATLLLSPPGQELEGALLSSQGEVQQLVCKDEGLAALDRKLDEVYKAARAKAANEVPPVLVASAAAVRSWRRCPRR